MKIAVIGTGHVGTTLGGGWAKAGHEVVFGTLQPDSAEAQGLKQNSVGKVTVSPIIDAAAAADVLVLAIPWSAVEEVLKEVVPHIAGKTLIDCTNPMKEWPALDHAVSSGGEHVARLAPRAKVVKAFNSTGFENMRNPTYPDGRASMFYAGDDSTAKKTAHELANALGFDAVDAGGLDQSHALEVLASFWGTLAHRQKLGRGIAFRLMRR